MKRQSEISSSSRQPMVGVAIFFVLGLSFGSLFVFPLWLALSLFLLSLGLNFMSLPRLQVFGFDLFSSLLIFFAAFVFSYLGDESLSAGNLRGVYEMRIEDDNELHLIARRSEGGEWHAIARDYYFRADSSLILNAGDRLIAYAAPKDFDTKGGFVYISKRNVYLHEAATMADASIFQRLGDIASQRLSRLRMGEEEQALMQSMLLGRREEMSAKLREAYRRSGAAHLLAVSGLHVGIVLMVLSTLLLPLCLFNGGYILRNILTVLAVSLYAFVVGLTPSVERATIMFVLLQIAQISRRHYTPLNALAVAVVLMLFLDPHLLENVGFQLSVVSVLSILLWALPILKRVNKFLSARLGHTLRKRAAETVAASVIISLSCALATLPLISYYFGYISVYGVLISPLLTFLTFFILMLSLLWVLFPFNFIAPAMAFVLEFCAKLQNGVVLTSTQTLDLRFDEWQVAIIYMFYALLTLLVQAKKSKQTPKETI